jgi:hypothetical protein
MTVCLVQIMSLLMLGMQASQCRYIARLWVLVSETVYQCWSHLSS